MVDKKKKIDPKQLAQQIRDYSANGTRGIIIFSETRKPLRDFVVTYVSEDGGYLAGHERSQKRVITMKFSEISDVRI
jgi:hypothetical protein